MSISFFNSREEFHSQRVKTIGSSDIPILAGLKLQYGSTPYDLWEVKTGRKPGFAGNEYTWWGTILEDNVLRKFVSNKFGSDIYGKEFALSRMNGENEFTITGESFDVMTLLSNTVGRNDEHPYAIAHADLWIPSENRIQEAKTARLFSAKRTDDLDKGYSPDDFTINGIPLDVYLQTQWQMFCYGADSQMVAGVSVLIDTSDYREYGLGKIDQKTIDKLVALADKFNWHVVNDKPPAPMTWDDVNKMFPQIQEQASVISFDYVISENNQITLRDMLFEREKLDKESKKITKKIDDIKNAIGLLIGENKILQSPDGYIIASQTDVTTERVAGIKDMEDEIIELLRKKDLIKESKYRKLTFKRLDLKEV